MSTVGADKWTPPYVSWGTLQNTIDRMVKDKAWPEQVDRSYLRNLPGGAQGELITAMKSLGLTDDNMRPSDTLKRMVAEPNDQPAILREAMERYYAGPLALSQHATQLQLEDSFRKYGVQGSTLRKAVRFFLAAAKFAEIPVSKNFHPPRLDTASRPRKQRVAGTPGESSATQDQPPAASPTTELHPFIRGLVDSLPAPGSYFADDTQNAWFDTARGIFRLIYAPTPERADPGGSKVYLDLSDADTSEPEDE